MRDRPAVVVVVVVVVVVAVVVAAAFFLFGLYGTNKRASEREGYQRVDIYRG